MRTSKYSAGRSSVARDPRAQVALPAPLPAGSSSALPSRPRGPRRGLTQCHFSSLCFF